MVEIIFIYNGKKTKISRDIKEKINKICQEFSNKEGIDFNKLNFECKGNKINMDLSLEQYFNKIDNKINSISIFVIEKKENELLGNDLRNILNININNESINPSNYNFTKNPNLKYRLVISEKNNSFGMNDLFEVFVSVNSNIGYIVLKDNNYNLNIFRLIDNKKIISLQGHKAQIFMIKYFINIREKKEYLISADDNQIIIIWDISNDYKIKNCINTNYDEQIFSCILFFGQFIDENYIITSTYSISDNNEISSSKMFAFSDGKFIKYLYNTNNESIYCLLSWFNSKNNKYYIIQLGKVKIIINGLIDDEYYELIKQNEYRFFSGFIYTKNNIDYLCTSSYNGYINIWDLYDKKIFKTIRISNNIYKSYLFQIIQWNDKYIIGVDGFNSFKIIDLDNNKVISEFGEKDTKNIKSIKKIYHPIYGESILTYDKDGTIKLWSI